MRYDTDISALREMLAEKERGFKCTLELITESIEMLAEERTEAELSSLESLIETLREEHDEAAEIEERICGYDSYVDRMEQEEKDRYYGTI